MPCSHALHPEKCAALNKNIAEAGLRDHVTVLEGDARETLQGVSSGIELLVLDGWKGMYLPVLKVLRAKLSDRALVVADNVDHEAAQDYLAHVQDPHSGFVTQCVGQLALSCAFAFAPIGATMYEGAK